MDDASILYESRNGTVVLVDLPRSIEDAQQLAHVGPEHQHNQIPGPASASLPTKRLISSRPPDLPFTNPEPKNQPSPPPAAAQVAQLMIQAAAEAALDELRERNAPWLLSRVLPQTSGDESSPAQKRRLDQTRPVEQSNFASGSLTDDTVPRNAKEAKHYFPPESHHILGSITTTRQVFLDTAPLFDLIIMDPPWPNRSAKRKRNNYNLAASTQDIRDLLHQIPVATRLAPDGLVAVWVTNKPAFMDLLTSPRDGLLESWGLEPVAEWAWLKVTAHGEPLTPLDSVFRKPWEPLLIARRKGSTKTLPPGWRRRVVVSVPDVHSRKPNLRSLLAPVLPPQFCGLEVFARNLTAGWWAWGDDVLRFQQCGQWVVSDDP